MAGPEPEKTLIDDIVEEIESLILNKEMINYKGELFFGVVEIPIKSGKAGDLALREVRKRKATR